MVQASVAEKAYGEQFDVEGLNFFRRLLAAIQNKEFVVYFQPKVSIRDLKIAGAEALVRWNCDGKILPPVEFIPFCERTGLVIDIDFYVLEATCKKMREWIDAGFEMVRISVNFSKYHFNQKGVAERIYKVIKAYQIPAEYIEVEFTETAYLDKEELLEYTVDKLKSYGIKSSIDDFGSGYSSLNLLQNMDFEVVKLDRSLLGKGVENEKAKKVISSIIHMAKELDMEVLAEGVETKEELQLLRELKCDIVQGFLFDKPLPMDEFEIRLKNRVYGEKTSDVITGIVTSIGEMSTIAAKEGEKVELKDVDLEEIQLNKKAGRQEARLDKPVNSSQIKKPEPVKPGTNRYDVRIAEESIKERKKSSGNNGGSGKGFLIIGIVLFLLSITAVGATFLWYHSEQKKVQVEPVEEAVTYTQEQVDTMLADAVSNTKSETELKTRSAYLTELHNSASEYSGIWRMLCNYFPDEVVFTDGTRYTFLGVNKDLKQNTLDNSRFVDDPITGYRYYTDEAGNKTSYVGIDVSSYQKDIDWKKVKASGVDFAIIKCAFRGYGSAGRLVEDKKFKENVEGAKAAGVEVGVYFFTAATTVDEAKEEAQMTLDLIAPYDIKGPVVIDIEAVNDASRMDGMTEEQNTDVVVAFCEAVKAAGKQPMVYSGIKYFVRKLNMERLEAYPKWYSYYNNPLYFPYEISIWQYSQAGIVDGVEGEVDLNVLFEKWW